MRTDNVCCCDVSRIGVQYGIRNDDYYSFVRTTRPMKVACWQSAPVKSASIRVACAVPTLPNVPLHPRGESNVPCVLIWAGGEPFGVSAAVAVVVMLSQA